MILQAGQLYRILRGRRARDRLRQPDRPWRDTGHLGCLRRPTFSISAAWTRDPATWIWLSSDEPVGRGHQRPPSVSGSESSHKADAAARELYSESSRRSR